MIPADFEIEAILKRFPGIGRLQAIRHIQSRQIAVDALARRRRAAMAAPQDRYLVITDQEAFDRSTAKMEIGVGRVCRMEGVELISLKERSL